MEWRLAAYWTAILLHITGWGVYYSVSRSLVERIGWSGVLLLASLETLPSFLSIPASEYAARRGYARLVYLSVPEALGLLLFGILPWPYSALAILVASIGWAIAGPQTVSAVLEGTEGRASRLGAVLTSGALGWSLGGFLGPLLYSHLGLAYSMLIASLLVAACYALLYAALPSTAFRAGGSRVGWLETLVYSLAVSPLFLATEAAFSAVMSRLSIELPPVWYGAVLAGTGVSSAAGKVVVGILTDHVGERVAVIAYRASFLAYSVWMLASAYTSGWMLAALFLTPIYPLFEIGFYTRASKLLGERRASSAWAASYTIAGLGVLALSALHLDYTGILLVSSTLSLVALASVLAAEQWIATRAVTAREGCNDARGSV